MNSEWSIHLRPGREGPARGGHPWVFSGALQTPPGDLQSGDTVAVRTARGEFVAWGLFNAQSQIRVRLYSWLESEPLTPEFWQVRILAALARRRQIPSALNQDAQRLIFSEADGVSGLVVDRFNRWLSVQITSAALFQRAPYLLTALEEALAPEGIVISTTSAPKEEGLAPESRVAHGELPHGPLMVQDRGIQMQVDLRHGQKTGYYLDQSENRMRVASWMTDRRVADLFCYSGGFGIHAVKAGAKRVTCIDSSAPALELAASNARLNDAEEAMDFSRAHAVEWLTAQAVQGQRYEGMILDPPRFAATRKGVGRAMKAYRELHAAAFAILAPGAILATFSCSGRVDRSTFLEAVAQGSRMAGRVAQVVEILGHPAHHPIALNCPETEYLKGLILQVD